METIQKIKQLMDLFYSDADRLKVQGQGQERQHKK
jgi:hypothetical protein